MHDHGQALQEAGRGRAVLLALLCCCLGWTQAQAQRAPRQFLAQGESARGRVLLPVYFGNSGPYPFLLDLAVRHPVVDVAVARALPLPVAELGEEDASAESPSAFLARALRCGGLPPQETMLAGVDLSGLTERLGRRVAGLWPAHQPGLEISIDFAAARITWYDFADSRLAAATSAIPMTLNDDGAPCVPVQLLDRVAHTLPLDISESGRIALSGALLSDLGVLRGDTPRLRLLSPAGTATTQSRVPSVGLAGVRYANIICMVVESEGDEYVGIDLLREFRLTLNYEFGLVGFERTAGAEVADPPLSGYGLVLDVRKGGTWTVRVAEGSPAHRAGIRSGDALLALANQPAVGASYEAVAAQLAAQPGTILRISYRHAAGPIRHATLTAEVLL